jgi:hypothetical protein
MCGITRDKNDGTHFFRRTVVHVKTAPKLGLLVAAVFAVLVFGDCVLVVVLVLRARKAHFV